MTETVAKVDKDKYADYIGKAIKDQAINILMEAKTQQAALELMLEEGWEGQASEVDNAFWASMAQAQSAETRLLKQIEDADEILPHDD